MDNPYQDALEMLDRRELQGAIDFLHSIGPATDPLAYDEAWAEVELERERLGEAAGLAEQTLAAGRDTPRLHEVAAQALWTLGTRAEAKRHAEIAGEGTARNAYLLAQMAFRDRQYLEAERLALQALELAPTWDEAKALRFAAQSATGEPDGRVALRLLWEETRNVMALQHLFNDAAERRELDSAHDLIREALAINVLDSSLLAHLLWVSTRLKDWDGAIAVFDAAPATARNTAYNLGIRGVASVGKGDFAEAVTFFERSFELEPTNEWTVDALYNALMRSGKWLRATRLVEEHKRHRKAAGIRESSIREYIQNLYFRHGRR